MKNRKSTRLFLSLSALALLAACDDNGNGSSNWADWFKSDTKKPTIMVGTLNPNDFVRETQSGNYLAGQFAQYRQDWTTANTYLDKIMKLDPSNVELQQRAMVLAMQAGDPSRAIMLARKVLESDNRNTLALLFIGVDQISRQEYGAAQETLAKMPKNGIADFIRPILIAWAGAPEKKVDLESLMVTGPLHAYHALLISDYLGKVNDPERYFITVLTGGGADLHILEMMGDVYARQGNETLYKKIYDTLLEQAPQSAAITSHVDVLKEKRDNPEKAAGTRIATPAQGAAEAFFNMARILVTDQSPDSALVFARISQHLDPAKDEAKILMAQMMIKADHTSEAIDFFKAVRPESPDYLEAQRSVAELLEKQNKTEEAVSFLNQNYERLKDVNSLIQIGDVYRRAEKHEEAIKAYNRAQDALGGKVSSDYWSLLYARGMSYERSGNLKKAEEDLQAAMEFQPNQPYLLNYLGYSWADQGKNLEKSLELIEKAVTLKPDDGYIVDSLGWVYYKTGKFENAVAELEKAVELVPYDSTINDHLGDAYWQVGRKNEARFQWQRALNHAKEDAEKTKLETKISNGIEIEKTPVVEAKTQNPDAVVKQ